MQEQFGEAIDQHRLRGEIVATKLAYYADREFAGRFDPA